MLESKYVQIYELLSYEKCDRIPKAKIVKNYLYQHTFTMHLPRAYNISQWWSQYVNVAQLISLQVFNALKKAISG